MLEITAIIVAYNSAHVLPACLAALKKEGVPALVVDNVSADASVAVAEAAGAAVVRNARNEGYGRGNNAGVRAATTDYVLIINPDAEVQPGALATLLQAARANPQAGMIGPKLIDAGKEVFHHDVGFLGRSMSGACFLIRRDMFLAVGGFDENIFLFFEDDDLCRRLDEAGHPPLYVPEAVVVHLKGASVAASANRPRVSVTRWHAAWSRFYVARKYGIPASPAGWILRNGLKYLLACVTFNAPRRARYAGSVLGAWAFMRGRTALEKQGLN